MKKYGKYEKRPEPAATGAAKTPKMKSLLLQTYFTSLLCMVLCVTMFLGTSYAWFTSEVQNTENQIYAGMLSVALTKLEGTNRYDMATARGGTGKLFYGTVWEPGYTALETIEVKNTGDLAFKYELRFTDGKAVAGNATAAAIAKEFDVYVYVGSSPRVESFGSILNSSQWTHVGSLDNVLAGNPVLENMQLTNKDDFATYTIALHMKETADSSVMGCKLNLNVQLIAYQMASESSDLGSGYDDVVPVATREALADALSYKKSILLTSGIEIPDKDSVLTVTGGVLDGAGKTIAYEGTANADNTPIHILSAKAGAISNLTVSGGPGYALYIQAPTADLFVTDCTFEGAYAFYMDGTGNAVNPDASVTFVDTTFKSPVSYTNAVNHVYFTNCSFSGTVTPAGDTTLTDCTIGSLDLSKLASGETVTLINCTYNGRLVERAVLTASGSNVTVTLGGDVIALNENKVVTLQ